MLGSKNSFSFAIVFSKESKSAGNKIKFENMASTKVIETKPPKATVPPKLEIIKTEKPKNNTIEV